MLFAPDTREALTAAGWLANSSGPPDCLTTVEQLEAFHGEFVYSGRVDRDEVELEEIRAIRPVLRRLLSSDRDSAVALVNDLLATEKAIPRLVRHDDLDWHIHATDDDKPLAGRIVVETAMAMIDLIRADDFSRLSTCADESCDGIVVDLSRNRSRIFCSTGCANRSAVAAYRARQATG